MMNASEALRTYLHANPIAAKHMKWLMQWDCSKTINENRDLLQIPNQPSTTNFCHKYNLSYREGYHKIVRTNKEAIEVLIKNGLTLSEIARLLKVSPQRIGQILKKTTVEPISRREDKGVKTPIKAVRERR